MEAEDGKEAVEITKQIAQKGLTQGCCKGFNLILMDLNMPILGGIEATQQIIESRNRFEVDQDLMIVAVTAFANETEKSKCLAVGMEEFIPKPFKISEFVRLISQ